MKRVILKWGLISGGIFALTMAVMMGLYVNGKVGLEKSELAENVCAVLGFHERSAPTTRLLRSSISVSVTRAPT